MQLLLQDPTKKLIGENRSKLLSHECELYKFIERIQLKMRNAGLLFDARPQHVELFRQPPQVHTEEGLTEYQKRTNEVHGRIVEPELSIMNRKALVINTGEVQGYGETHVTVAYFKEGISERQLRKY